MLLVVAMACATVFESSVGTEQALAAFYKSWWFRALLGLVGVNMLAALAPAVKALVVGAPKAQIPLSILNGNLHRYTMHVYCHLQL